MAIVESEGREGIREKSGEGGNTNGKILEQGRKSYNWSQKVHKENKIENILGCY